MSEIKNIHCFGTSFTAGGGFEWNTNDSLKDLWVTQSYGHLDIPKNQWSFSWPGRFQEMLNKDNDIKVHNHAKQGYGNQRVYREAYKVIEDKNFDKETSLFIIELSWTGRRDFYYYPLNDYIIGNYGFQPDKKYTNRNLVNHVDLAHSYWYDDEKIQKELENHESIFRKFMNLTMDGDEVLKEISRNLAMFFAFLNENGIKYYISSLPPINLIKDHLIKIDLDKVIKFKYNGIESDYLELFIRDARISIKDETDNKYDDFHAGFFGNNLIASQIYNKILKDGLINGNNIDSSTLPAYKPII